MIQEQLSKASDHQGRMQKDADSNRVCTDLSLFDTFEKMLDEACVKLQSKNADIMLRRIDLLCEKLTQIDDELDSRFPLR
ncbi:hypothetical protein FACS1894102_1260 [Spirochaetia bacterium]|nr:hypothetical protein FACS1894102_1260 [Spirochaetia bacterium]